MNWDGLPLTESSSSEKRRSAV